MFSKGEVITILKSKTVTEVCLGILTGGFIHLSVRPGASLSMILIGL